MGFGAPSLKGKALQWLAQREHTRAELQKKRQRHARKALRLGTACGSAAADDAVVAQEQAKQEQAKINPLLDELAAAGLQSDTRAAQSLARVKSSRYGVHWLRQELQAKGLAAELVATTVGAARETEFERARALWLRRYGQVAQDLPARLRQARFLTARGFDADVVRRVVRGETDAD